MPETLLILAIGATTCTPGIEFLWALELQRQLLSLLADAETSVAIRAETALATVSPRPEHFLLGVYVQPEDEGPPELLTCSSDSSGFWICLFLQICTNECAPRFVLEGAFLSELKRLATQDTEVRALYRLTLSLAHFLIVCLSLSLPALCRSFSLHRGKSSRHIWYLVCVVYAQTICFRVLSPLVHGIVQHQSFLVALCSAAPEVLARLQQLLTNKEDILLQPNACDLLSTVGVCCCCCYCCCCPGHPCISRWWSCP